MLFLVCFSKLWLLGEEAVAAGQHKVEKWNQARSRDVDLARSVYFTAKLMKEKGHFKACDIPHADEFTDNILAAVAQKAAKDNFESTKRGLAAKKA